MRSSCSREIETCKTGQFSQMELVELAFCFGFLATGSQSEFSLASGVLGKMKGSLYQPILFPENLVSLIFLFFFKNLEKFKASITLHARAIWRGKKL